MSNKISWRVWSLLTVATVATVGLFSLVGHRSPPTRPNQSSAPAAVVTDRKGFSLYRFDESSLPVPQRRTDPRVDPWPDRRLLTCDAGTPPDWPVVDYEQNRTLAGVDAKLLGYLERADGHRQLTINGCPIYRYRGDQTPGQNTGNSVAGTWFCLTAADLGSAHRSRILHRGQ
jgi:predicted lipoprotein with Yx(FWY)xxD motif